MHIYALICMYTYISTYTSIYLYLNISTNICIYTYIHVHACIHTDRSSCVHICNIHTCACMKVKCLSTWEYRFQT